jgi:hypothetical protein
MQSSRSISGAVLNAGSSTEAGKEMENPDPCYAKKHKEWRGLHKYCAPIAIEN